MGKVLNEPKETHESQKAKPLVWDCESSLYDSFELKSFERQLESAITRARSLSMPHFIERRAPQAPPALSKKYSKISRSLHKFIRSVFRPKQSSKYSSSLFRVDQERSQDGVSVVFDRYGALTTIPEVPENVDAGGRRRQSLSPDDHIRPLVGRSASHRFTATSIDDTVKVGLLTSMPNADNGLVLFKADIYNPAEFEAAIEGCHFVFHVATPMLHTHNSQYKDTTEAAIAGVRIIADTCLRSQNVKRLIYTASITASSPLKEDGTGFKYCVDESCWTPINLSLIYDHDFLQGYITSKTLAEKEILSYNDIERSRNLQVVSLCVGLVGGDTLLSYVPSSMDVILSPVRGNLSAYRTLQFLEQLLGSVPLVHIEDVCDAHIFCIEKPSSIKGRFLCSNGNPTTGEIADYYRANHPDFQIPQELLGVAERRSRFDSTELVKQGFEYKFNMAKILDDSVECGRRLGVLL